ncbi:MAG: hypothetical protein ACFFKA_21890 [Candidatus Thorarchaeota archaeon]
MFDYNDEIKHNISVAAYFLAQKALPYEKLCWMLAERQLYLQNNFQKPEEGIIRDYARHIFTTEPTYDVLCWLISEIDYILKINNFKGNKKPSFIFP